MLTSQTKRLSVLTLAALLQACSSSPPVQLYQLRAEAAEVGSASAAVANAPRWVISAVLLPDYLDRDTLLRPVGQAGLNALSSHRWAEPLRDAVPRLLQQDLARLRGVDRIWRGALPPGLVVDRQLRVELQQFEPRADGLAVQLSARWSLIDPQGKAAPQVMETRLEVPSRDASPDALVAAHRTALWQLAQDISNKAR